MVAALGEAAGKNPSYFEEPDSFFPVLQAYIHVVLLPLLAETPLCCPLEKLLSCMLMGVYEMRTKKAHELAILRSDQHLQIRPLIKL